MKCILAYSLYLNAYRFCTARSTSGEVAGLSSQLGRVQIPHELLKQLMGLPTGRRFDLHSRLQGSTSCRSAGGEAAEQ